MIRCPICSADNEDSERFCRDCGQKLPTSGRPPAAPPEAQRDAQSDNSASASPAAGGTGTAPPSPPSPGLDSSSPGTSSSAPDAIPSGSDLRREPPTDPISVPHPEPATSEHSASDWNLTATENAPTPGGSEPALADSPGPASAWSQPVVGARVNSSAAAPALTSLEAEDSGTIPCPECGVLNETSFRFCKSCGRSLPTMPSPGIAPAIEDAAADSESGLIPPPRPPFEQEVAGAPGDQTMATGRSAGPDLPAASQTEAPARRVGPSDPTGPLTSPIAESPADTLAPPAPPLFPPSPAQSAAPAAAEPAASFVLCPTCGRRAVGGERFCSECGSRLPEPAQPTEVACPSCGTKCDAGDKFCKNCGTRIPPPAAAAPTGPRLILVSNGEETIYPLDKPELSIGRHPTNQIAISSDGYISSHHARVVVDDEDFAFVEDTGSTNGTFLRVRGRVPLTDGDEIKVGQSILRYVS